MNLMIHQPLLTAEIAGRVLKLAVMPSLILWRKRNWTISPGFAHFVVMDPLRPPSLFDFDQAILHEETFIHISDDPQSVALARRCAQLAWGTGVPIRHLTEEAPYIHTDELPADCGSAVANGIVVACGGVRMHYADAFCASVAAMCVAAAQDSFREPTQPHALPPSLMFEIERGTASTFSEAKVDRKNYRLVDSDHQFDLITRLMRLRLSFEERCYCAVDLDGDRRWFDCTEISVRIDTFYGFILNNVPTLWFVGPAIEP